MLLTGPSFKRFALRVKEEELLSLFIQSELGIWKTILDRSEEFEYLGCGLTYLDLMNDSGDEVDSKSSSTPSIDSKEKILIIQERGKLFEQIISEATGISAEINGSGLIDKAVHSKEITDIDFIPRDTPEYSCRILHNGSFIDSKFIESTYKDFIEYVKNPDNGVTFSAIHKSSYYEDDHSLGGNIHELLLSFPQADFHIGALEYFDDEELITLSQNDSLTDSLVVGLFKQALSMINCGEGPYDEWSEEEKLKAGVGETVRNNLLGNSSMYANRQNVYTDTDIIDWFIENNLNTVTQQAILRNKDLGVSYLKKISAKSSYRILSVTRHPAWIKAKMDEVNNSISDSFEVTIFAGNGVTENVEVEYEGERFNGTRIWQSGDFTQRTGKSQLLEYYQLILNSSIFTHENIQINGDFELGTVNDGYWEDDSMYEPYQNGDIEDFEYIFDVTDVDFNALPVSVKVEVTLSSPTQEIEMYGDIIEEFYQDITLVDDFTSGYILLSSPNEHSFFEGLNRMNERPSFLVDFIDKLHSNAMNWYIEEFELAGETILEGMEMELSGKDFESFKINIGEVQNKLEEMSQRLSLKNTLVFEDYPVKLELSPYVGERAARKNDFISKYPYLEDRFIHNGNTLSFIISHDKEISERNWTIDFLESNINYQRAFNGLGKTLESSIYSDLYDIFESEDNKVYFSNGNHDCIVESVGKFEAKYSFLLTRVGLMWNEQEN